jgi:hypothetical protein
MDSKSVYQNGWEDDLWKPGKIKLGSMRVSRGKFGSGLRNGDKSE